MKISPAIVKDVPSTIDNLLRVRLALGRRLYDVDLVVLQKLSAGELSPQQKKFLLENNVQVVKVEENVLSQYVFFNDLQAVFLVNPKDYWVLRYNNVSNLDEIYQDLKKLLIQGE